MCAKCDTLEHDLTVEVLFAEAERALILAQTDAGESVPGAIRPLSPAEKRAKMRFGEIEALEQAAAAEAAKLLAGNAQVYIRAVIGEIFGAADDVAPGQVVDAIEQVNRAQPQAVIAETARSQKVMSAILGQVYAGAGQIVIGEAKRQGVTKTPKPLVAAAGQFDDLAKAVALHPWTRLTGKLQADMLEPRTLAKPSIAKTDVQASLEAIPLDGAEDLARQTIHAAHGAGRVEAAKTMAPQNIHASELLDGATCDACARVDGKDYDTMTEAEIEYETGGYGACRGGGRCRGTLVFEYDPRGTAAPLAPVKPIPVLQPPEPAPTPKAPAADTPWAKAAADAKKALPADRTKIGVIEDAPDFDVMVAAERQKIFNEHGGDLAALKKRHAEIAEKLADWDALNRHVISYIPAKWPDSAKPLVKKLGFGRQGPKAVAALLRDGRRDLWEMESDAGSAVAQMERKLGEVEDYVKRYKMKALRRDDVLPDGSLGEATAKALDSTIAAGKALDDELQARLEKRLGPSPLDTFRKLDDKRRAIILERASTEDDALFEKLGGDLEKIQAEIDANILKARPYKKARADAMREEAAALLADVRAVGGGGRPTYTKGIGWNAEVADAMEGAHKLYPDDWNDKLAGMLPEIELKEVDRGFNGETVMALSRDRGALSRTELSGVAVHELGHAMERAVPGLKGLEWALHHRRSEKIRRVDGTVELKPAFDIYGKDIGMGREVAHADEWATDYTGKTYRQFRPDDAGADSLWEVFQTGVESLFEGSQYFARQGTLGDDAEFRHFILGVLSVL